MNSELIRKDFPILETKVNGYPVVYFDNGATTQRPPPVMRAVMDYVTRNNGNPSSRRPHLCHVRIGSI